MPQTEIAGPVTIDSPLHRENRTQPTVVPIGSSYVYYQLVFGRHPSKAGQYFAEMRADNPQDHPATGEFWKTINQARQPSPGDLIFEEMPNAEIARERIRSERPSEAQP